MNASTGQDDRAVEDALRSILEPLDRHLARMAVFFAPVWLTLVSTVFGVLWLGVRLSGTRSLVLAGLVGCALIVLNLSLEIVIPWMARSRFDQRFPPGAPDRAVALRILAEMQTPTRAEEKLRDALSCVSPDRIIRHRRDGDAPSSDLGTPRAVETQHRAGYYDYIPLEPFGPEARTQPGRGS